MLCELSIVMNYKPRGAKHSPGAFSYTVYYRLPSCQKATALAAATFKESTP